MSGSSYFAASNTERGFVSYFAENFRERADRCYIIKGGPGTGKSRLMKEMGAAAGNAGASVEYYYCSSDPTSLDGIYIEFGEDSVAVLDGTAPHAEDIVSPGTVDNIIDLGSFWNVKLLRERKEEISLWGSKKREAYASAYLALSAYGKLTRAADALILQCTDTDALETVSIGIAEGLERGRAIRSPLSAIGMRGICSFDTFRQNAGRTVCIADSRGYGISYLCFESLVPAIGGCRTAPHPVLAGRYSGLLSGGVAVVEASITDTGERAVDVSEFVDREAYLALKARAERLRRLAEGALAEAEAFFREAGEAHAELEAVFAASMDFKAKEAHSRELCAKIARGDL